MICSVSLKSAVKFLFVSVAVIFWVGLLTVLENNPFSKRGRGGDYVDLTILPEVPIYTFGHYVHPYLCLLTKSVFHSSTQHPLRVLGMNSKCKNKLECHMDKVTAMEKHMTEDLAHISDDQLFVFVDGFDVLFQRDVGVIEEQYYELEKKFPNHQNPIIFNGESNCYPFTKMQDERYNDPETLQVKLANDETVLPKQMCNKLKKRFDHNFDGPKRPLYPHLNSGVYIGRKGKILDMLDKVQKVKQETPPELFMGDQGMVQIASLKHPELDILVDYNQTMFATINQHQDNYFVWNTGCHNNHFNSEPPFNPPLHLVTNTRPAVLHFNSKRSKNMISQCAMTFEKHWRKNFKKSGQEHYIDVDGGKVKNGKRFGKKVYVDDVCPAFGATVTWAVAKYTPVLAVLGLWGVLKRK